MATIVTRAGKGSPLTHDEVDDNFSNLNTDKLETSGDGSGLTNIARKVWESSQGSGSSVNYWAKVATYSITGDFDDGSFIYHFVPEEFGTGMPAIVAVNVRNNNASGGDSHTLNVELMSKPHTYPFSDDSFKLIDNGGTSDIEFWVKKNDNYGQVVMYEMSAHVEDSGFTVAYNQNAAWQASEPTGSGLNIKTVGVKVAGNFTASGTATAAAFAGDGSALTGISGGIAYTRHTANVTMAANEGVIADTSGGTFTVTLPASPTTGDTVVITDGGDWATTNLTVGRNGSTIEGDAADMTMDIGGVAVQFTYDGTTWQIYTQLGAAGGNVVSEGDSPTFGGLTVDTDTLFVDSANNRVGIGKTNPATALDVDGTVTTTSLVVNGNNYPSAGSLSNRNILINGNLNVNQRGLSIASVATGAYGEDRWKKTAGGMTQIVEEVNYLSSTVYTLSGTGVTTQQITSPPSGNWTLPDIPVTARLIQLEVGNTATPFEHRSYGQELALCQRYFQPFGAGAVGAEESASQASFGITFAAPMRTNPTNTLRQAGISVRIPSIPTDRTMTSTINGATVIGPSGGWLYLNISGGVAGRQIIERVGATIGFADAEL